MVWTRRLIFILYQVCLTPIWRFHVQKREGDQERHGQKVCMLAALVASTHKTEPTGDQVLEVLAAFCLPQLLGQTAADEK